jgi:hypothetical protein
MTRARLIAALLLLVASICASGALPQPASEADDLVAVAPPRAERGLVITEAAPNRRGVNSSACINPWTEHGHCKAPL